MAPVCVCVCARFTYCNFIFIVNKALAHTTHTGTATDTHTRIPHTQIPSPTLPHTQTHTPRRTCEYIFHAEYILSHLRSPTILTLSIFLPPPSLSLSSHLLPHHNSVYKLLKSKIIEKQLQQQLQIQQTYKKWKKRNIWKTKKKKPTRLFYYVISSL